MNAVVLDQATNGAIVHVLWGLLLLAMCVLFAAAFWIVHQWKLLQTSEITKDRLEALALHMRKERRALNEGVECLKVEVRRADAIRVKCEQRLKEQNNELDVLRCENVIYKAHYDAKGT